MTTKHQAQANIPLLDLGLQVDPIRAEIDRAIASVIDRNDFIQGEDVRLFESEFAEFCSVDHAIGVSSGTDALHLALLACGIGPGDEVITTTLTFIATAEAICQVGATPVFVDIDPADCNLDPALFEGAITDKTAAVIPVHLYGTPANMDEILRIAARHDLFVIEDAAQAHGANYKRRRTGGIGDLGCFSFYPGKNLGAFGDAGMVTTNDVVLADKIRLLRDHGRNEKYLHRSVGFNARIDTLQAAVLRVKLRRLEMGNAARQSIAGLYRELLAGSGVQYMEDFSDRYSVYHQFVVRVPERDTVMEKLKASGISTGIHYPVPLHMQPAFEHLGYMLGDMPVAESAANEILSLPIYPELTEPQIFRVVEYLVAAVEEVSNPHSGRIARGTVLAGD